MLIDDVTIKVSAGKGGDGVVAFNTTKNSRGPTGGNGGNGGNVYFEGVSDIGALRQFRFEKELRAENGERGHYDLRDGASGKDLTVKIPAGTVIHNLETGTSFEILNLKDRLIIAKGGKGGKGNFLFRSSTNTTPKEFEQGKEGENFTLRLELKFIADAGFIGLPNAGKSSLLNMLTNAKSKVANYPFTTLEPNLGAYYNLILADIPGLIEGASSGKGLGIKFLRHIERTKALFHFISAESKNPAEDYKTIRNELEKYNKNLLEKPEYVFISKSDLAGEEKLQSILKSLEEINIKAMPISIYDEKSLILVKQILSGMK